MWSIDRPQQWVGRTRELAIVRVGLESLGRGEGALVWVEGEPGIGKSSLVARALAAGGDSGWDIGWGTADKLTERLPLRLMLDCLQVRPDSPDPLRARAAGLLQRLRGGPFPDGDTSDASVEVLVELVDELSAAAPVVMVLDDLQWADDASLVVWQSLAGYIDQLRLVLIGICRPTPRREEVLALRASVARRGGGVLTLGPLAETDVSALVTSMLGAPPGDELRQLTVQAGGNPLYVRELVDALTRERAVEIGPAAAEVSASPEHPSASLAAALNDRLSSVSADTAQILRTAALLGGKFAVADLGVVLRRPVSDLAAGVQEAVAAGILIGSGPELMFRHMLIQQALYESMPAALRAARHIEAARELAAAGADVLSVAQHLSAANRPGEKWVREWLIKSGPALANTAPQLAAELLRRELNGTPAHDEDLGGIMTSLVWALLAAGSYAEAASQASRALITLTDPMRLAETSWALTRAQVSAGHSVDAIATLQRALASAGLPGEWRARMLARLAMLEREATGDLGAADATAIQALTAAEEAGDLFATAQALGDLWLTRSVRRDHVAALDHIDRALRVLGDDPGYADMRSFARDARIFTLQNLDRWQEAESALRQARELARTSGNPDRGTWANAAVLRYWLGQWDDALAELGSGDDVPGLTHSFLRERWSALLLYGVSALIAVRRDEHATAERQLRQGLALPIHTLSDRENQDFLVAAHAFALERGGDTREAMLRLAAMLPRRDGEMTLVHQWLPDLVRLALAAGDRQMARTAAQACQAEGAAETQPARAAAASLRCRGLLESDPDQLQEAVAHYRAAGPTVELPAALEDLAATLAERGLEADARATLIEAVSRYEGLHAYWDIRRAEGRLRSYGVGRAPRGRPRRRATSGWEALTPTEVKVAAAMARGDSTGDIAKSMYLSPRTVQTYVSRILTKLGGKSRVDIVREALRQGVSPESAGRALPVSDAQ